MNAIAAWFSEAWTFGWASLALDVVCKATVLLSIAVLAAAILRRSSAAIRHRVWCLTFAGLVLLPVLSAALPEWRLEVLPYSSPLAPREVSPDEAWRNEPTDQLAPRLASTDTGPTSRATLFADPPSFVMPGGPLAEREDYFTPAFSPDTAGEPIVSEPADGPQESRGPIGLAAFWLLGAIAAASPLPLGLLRNYLLRRRAQPVAEAAWTGLLDELRNRLNLRRRVMLYETQAALMPMTWGMLSPIVMLPHRARQWTDRLRRFVLLHELAHVKRCDVGFQMLARLACALYWFHPLAWYALRRLRIERELACDDCVVQAGERPSDYAAELLAIARNYRPFRLAAAVPMAQTSNLEHRIRALFDRARSHLPISARAARLLLLTAAVTVTSIAVVRLAPRTAAEAEEVASSETERTDPKPRGNEAAPANRDEPATVRGSVFMPDGQPAAGVVVYARLPSSEKTPQLQTETDDAGRFHLALPQPLFNEQDGSKVEILVYAVADRLVHDWTYIWGQRTDDVVLRLSTEKAIEGRIRNAEGRPLAGVELQVDDVARYRGKGLQLLFDDLSNGRNILREYSHWDGALPGQPDAVKTDADGRFCIAGISADDVAKIKVRGAGIRHTTFEATAALRDTIRGPVPPVEPPFPSRPGRVLYGSPFDYIAEPARSIYGVVRARRTGAPVPGAKVRCWDATTDETETDELGRFILAGCAKQPQYVVSIEPAPDGPAYFPATLTIADETGLKPLSRYFELVEGVALRGRIIDDGTGRPLKTRIHYAPLHLNAHVAALFEQHVDLDTHSQSEADGSFRIVVAPGPGVLGIDFPSGAFEQYLSIGVGHDDVVKLFEQSPEHRSLAQSPELHRGLPDSLPTASSGGWSFISQTGHARMVLISPGRQKPPEPLEVHLVLGRTLRGRLVDPSGQPFTGATAYGLYITGIRAQVISGSEFTVHAVAPDDEREISFEHQGRRLGAFRAIGVGESEPITVRLESYGAATGRVVDEQGGPVEAMHVWFYPISSNGMQGGRAVFAITDVEGRFKIDELIPGQQYEVSRSEPGATSRRLLSLDKFSVDSGKTCDLGDLVLGSPVGRQNVSAAAPARTMVRGRVLDPSGNPLGGSKIYFWYFDRVTSDGELRATTAPDGRFEFVVDKSKLSTVATDDPWSTGRITATAEGYGYQWVEVAKPDADGGYTLRLVDDVPVHGRILTLEGQPVFGAKLKVRSVHCFAHDRLDEYITAWRSGRTPFRPDRFGVRPPDQPESVATDAEGRFSLRGYGAERELTVLLAGDGIASMELPVMTRDTEPAVLPESMGRRLRNDRAYGANFTYLAQPGRTIRGTVRELGTGKPLAGVYLHSPAGTVLNTRSDEAGRFEMAGRPKGRAHVIQATCRELPYFVSSTQLEDTPGLEPIDAVIELARGIEARGRVTIAPSGKPNPAQVEYYPLQLNPYTGRIGPRLAKPCAYATCDADGRYTIAVLPGPGILTYRFGPYSKASYRDYQSAWLTRSDLEAFYESAGLKAPPDAVDDFVSVSAGEQIVSSIRASQYNEVVLINPPDNVSASIEHDIQLSLGGRVAVRVIGPEGEPLAGAIARGVNNATFEVEKLDTAEFMVTGLNPRIGRHLIVEQRDRKLGAYRLLQGEVAGPITMRLEPWGTLTGRLLDASGEPLADMRLEIGRQWMYPGDFAPTTDAQGRFRVDGLVPGLKYGITARDVPGYEGILNRPLQDIVMVPGETKDLGDVRLKPFGGTPQAAASEAANKSSPNSKQKMKAD